jgi:hypothetical protein
MAVKPTADEDEPGGGRHGLPAWLRAAYRMRPGALTDGTTAPPPGPPASGEPGRPRFVGVKLAKAVQGE